MDNKTPPFFVDLDAASAFAQKAMLAHMVMQAMKHYKVESLPYAKMFSDGSGGIGFDKYGPELGHVIHVRLLDLNSSDNDTLTEYLSSIGLKARLRDFLNAQVSRLNLELDWGQGCDSRWGMREAFKDVLKWLEGEIGNK